MDGNGRWAQQRSRPRTFGHIKGARNAKKIITAAREIGVEYLTLYAFSTENWLRPMDEVQLLMKLLDRYLERETANLIRQDIRFTIVGDMEKLSKALQASAKETMAATAHCKGMHLNFALSYGSRAEIVQTTKALAEKVARGELNPDEIDETLFNAHLKTYPAPDVDLIIRTSGEQRLSNFLLWQAAYSELFFTETLWPEFNKQELLTIVHNFSQRERRFGGISAPQGTPSTQKITNEELSH